uniref:Uncharacterized protein n=1 Tax=Oryza brachyantha TaxID=4533 RepID=J3LRG0_ORYBR
AVIRRDVAPAANHGETERQCWRHVLPFNVYIQRYFGPTNRRRSTSVEFRSIFWYHQKFMVWIEFFLF